MTVPSSRSLVVASLSSRGPMREQSQDSAPIAFTLCEQTGAMAIQGACPRHGGDACLAQFVLQSALQEVETQREDARHEAGIWKTTCDAHCVVIGDLEEETARLSARNAELEEREAIARRVITALAGNDDEDKCRRDHHGYCQAHFLEMDCSVARGRAWLAASLPSSEPEL